MDLLAFLKTGAAADRLSLQGVSLDGMDLSAAKLRGVSMYGVSLRGARLAGADLRQAKLTNVDLSEADLSGADLSEALIVRDKVPVTDGAAVDVPLSDLEIPAETLAVLSKQGVSGFAWGAASLVAADLPYPHAKHPLGPESVRKYLKGSGE